MKLAPIPMNPAYRHGSQTPWGGDNLKKVFGKDIPDDRTGESLELSAIPGLNSVSDKGEKFGDLIARYGQDLTGTAVTGEFPLLLKLLDARDTLSVQVHPDDTYAGRVEGKLGKTEAWVILHAKEGAQLVYGVKGGVSREELRAASEQGKAVEGLLRRVDVKPGDVYFIPAGMVHAIGEGIMLYEIQQSSDVTYRFYDWERTDKNGNKRELHIDKAIDVTDLENQPEAAKAVDLGNGRYQMLKEHYFSLEKWVDCENELKADPRIFKIVTAIKETRITWENGECTLNPGCTALLPANGYDLTIRTGEMLMSYPTVD